MSISLAPELYKLEDTPQDALIKECEAHHLPYSNHSKFDMGKALKKKHQKYHSDQDKKKDAPKSMNENFNSQIV